MTTPTKHIEYRRPTTGKTILAQQSRNWEGQNATTRCTYMIKKHYTTYATHTANAHKRTCMQSIYNACCHASVHACLLQRSQVSYCNNTQYSIITACCHTHRHKSWLPLCSVLWAGSIYPTKTVQLDTSLP